MTKLNWGLIACGVVGLIVALALPLIEAPIKVKMMDVGGGHAWLVILCLVGGAAMGAINLFNKPQRWTAIVALIAFLIVGMKMSGGDEVPGVKVGAGATGTMVLAFVGMLIALALVIKPGKKA